MMRFQNEIKLHNRNFSSTRTPVTGVRFGLDALTSEVKGPLNKDQKEILDKMHRA